MKRYIYEITATLANFQLLEESLRIYISKANKIIKEKLKGKIPFRYNYEWVKKDSLGTLITKFAKINRNKKLTEKLKQLLPDRNKIAHKGLLMAIDELHDNSSMVFKSRKLREIRVQTKGVLNQIHDEIRKIEQN